MLVAMLVVMLVVLVKPWSPLSADNSMSPNIKSALFPRVGLLIRVTSNMK